MSEQFDLAAVVADKGMKGQEAVYAGAALKFAAVRSDLKSWYERKAVLAQLPEGSRSANVTLTTDNGTQFTSSRFLETLGRLGITHREEVWAAEYRSLEEARTSIARWIEEYNHDRPHRGVHNRTPHEAFLAFKVY